MSEVVLPVTSGQPNARLHQPWRLAVAAVELLVAGLAVWGGVLSWGAAIRTVTVRLDDGTELVSRVYAGDRIGIAVGLAAVGGVLVLDAVRQLMLGVRARRRRYRTSRQEGRADEA